MILLDEVPCHLLQVNPPLWVVLPRGKGRDSASCPPHGRLRQAISISLSRWKRRITLGEHPLQVLYFLLEESSTRSSRDIGPGDLHRLSLLNRVAELLDPALREHGLDCVPHVVGCELDATSSGLAVDVEVPI